MLIGAIATTLPPRIRPLLYEQQRAEVVPFTEAVPIQLNRMRCPRRVHLGTGISSRRFSA